MTAQNPQENKLIYAIAFYVSHIPGPNIGLNQPIPFMCSKKINAATK